MRNFCRNVRKPRVRRGNNRPMKPRFVRPRPQEAGYSLLALIIAIAALAIMLAGSLNTFHAETMREKEIEFIFRGEEVAKAIARYNNGGRLQPLRLGGPYP